MYTQQCEKCLVRRGECVTTGGLYRPTHLCVAHFELHKEQKNKKFKFFSFLWCGKVGGEGFGEGGGSPCFRR